MTVISGFKLDLAVQLALLLLKTVSKLTFHPIVCKAALDSPVLQGIELPNETEGNFILLLAR